MNLAGMTGDFQADVEAIPRIDAVPRILDVICRTMGEGFARRSWPRTAMNSSRAPAADQSQCRRKPAFSTPRLRAIGEGTGPFE